MRAILVSLTLVAASLQTALGASPREFELTYAGEIHSLPAGSTVEAWIPLASSREGQKILERRIEIPLSYEIHKEPVYGNEMIYLKTSQAPLPRRIPFTIRYRARVDEELFQKDRDALSEPEAKGQFLKPSRLMTVSDRVREITWQVVPPNAGIFEKARAIYEFVIRHMRYDKQTPGWGRGDTERACVLGVGNCTDFHSLFISVAHAAEIPSRFKIGFSVPPGGEGELKTYHCWAEFYDPALGWQPVDASEAWRAPEKKDYYFARFDPDKFLISVGRDVELAPRQKGESVNIFFYPHVEVDGKAVETVKTQFHFKNVH